MGWRRTKAGLDQMTSCLNCGAQVRGQFCPICGQRNDDLKRSISVLAREVAEDIFAYDSRFYRTLNALFLHPGRLTRDFSEGRRARYMPPIRLYLISTILLFIALSFSDVALLSFELDRSQESVSSTGDINSAGIDTISFFKKVEETDKTAELISEENIETTIAEAEGDAVASGLTQSILEGLNAVARDARVANQVVNNWLPRVMLLLLPLFALALKFLYIFQKQLLLNHAVYSLHFHSSIFLILTILIAAQWAADGRLNGGLLAQGYIASTAIYSLAALKGFYRQGWIKTVIKWLALGIAYISLFFVSLGFSVWMNFEMYN